MALLDWLSSLRIFGRERAAVDATFVLDTNELIWALGSCCALHRKLFDPALLLQQYPAPHSADTLILAARALGFRIIQRSCPVGQLKALPLPALVVLAPASDRVTSEGVEPGSPPTLPRLALLVRVSPTQISLFHATTHTVTLYSLAEFSAIYSGRVFQFSPAGPAIQEPDAVTARQTQFGFRWFVPELLKYRRIWRDVLAASLAIQLMALATPRFAQVVIDKVVVHRTQSTLLVITLGMSMFPVFSSLLSWVRQYLILHTGNRVDAVLGAAVFDHLVKLPPRYFEQRPTGVITARLRGVETIREFIASAAVTVLLDLPFLLLFIAVMFDYSVRLTL